MEYKLDLGPWNTVFAVPCSLVDRHLKLAGKEQLQVILWVLRHAGEAFRVEDVTEQLGISADSARDALDYWADRGVLAVHGGDLHPIPQQPAPALTNHQAPQAEPAAPAPETDSGEKPSALPPKRRMTKPDAVYLAARMKESAAIRSLLQEAEATLGILSPAMTATLLASCDDYGLPAEVVAMLIHYAKEVGKTSTAYIDSVARDWAQSGVFDLQAAEAKLQELSEKRLAWGRVSAAAGLPKRSPTKKEEEAAYRWVYEWKFTPDLLTAAYERCADNTGKFSAAYMDKVLDRWHREGIRNLSELEQAEQQQKQKQETGKSYNIDELEELSFLDIPEDL